MKERKCPFLETKVVIFCKGYPMKMIPLDKMSSTKCLCNTMNFQGCSLYTEISGTGKCVEVIKAVNRFPG